jgi:hypothetical protein
MRSNAILQPPTKSLPHPTHPAVQFRSKVICINCYRTLGVTASARREVQLRYAHDCLESRVAKQPGAPPPFN